MNNNYKYAVIGGLDLANLAVHYHETSLLGTLWKPFIDSDYPNQHPDKAWIDDYIHIKQLDVIKPSLKWGHGWITTSHTLSLIELIIQLFILRALLVGQILYLSTLSLSFEHKNIGDKNIVLPFAKLG